MLRAEVKVIAVVKLTIATVFRLDHDHPPLPESMINRQLRQRQQQPLPDSNDVDAMQDELPPMGTDGHKLLQQQHPPLRDERPKQPNKDRNRQRERIPPLPSQPLGYAKCG